MDRKDIEEFATCMGERRGISASGVSSCRENSEMYIDQKREQREVLEIQPAEEALRVRQSGCLK